MEPCTTYQNTHHQLMVVIGSQQGEKCWPFRFKLMSNIKYILNHINFCSHRLYDINPSVQLVCKYLNAYKNRADKKRGINKLFNEICKFFIILLNVLKYH